MIVISTVVALKDFLLCVIFLRQAATSTVRNEEKDKKKTRNRRTKFNELP